MLSNTHTEKGLRPVYLNINREGQIYRTSEDGTKDFFDTIDGELVSIKPVTKTYRGEETETIQIHLLDPEEGTDQVLSLKTISGVARSIILTLANIDHFEKGVKTKIHTYQAGGYTKTQIAHDGHLIAWLNMGRDLPPLKEVQVGGKIYKDSTDRDLYVRGLLDQINAKLQTK